MTALAISRERAGNPRGERASSNLTRWSFAKTARSRGVMKTSSPLLQRELAETFLRHLDVDRSAPLGHGLDLDDRARGVDVFRRRAKASSSPGTPRDLQRVRTDEDAGGPSPPDGCTALPLSTRPWNRLTLPKKL